VIGTLQRVTILTKVVTRRLSVEVIEVWAIVVRRATRHRPGAVVFVVGGSAPLRGRVRPVWHVTRAADRLGLCPGESADRRRRHGPMHRRRESQAGPVVSTALLTHDGRWQRVNPAAARIRPPVLVVFVSVVVGRKVRVRGRHVRAAPVRLQALVLGPVVVRLPRTTVQSVSRPSGPRPVLALAHFSDDVAGVFILVVHFESLSSLSNWPWLHAARATWSATASSEHVCVRAAHLCAPPRRTVRCGPSAPRKANLRRSWDPFVALQIIIKSTEDTKRKKRQVVFSAPGV